MDALQMLNERVERDGATKVAKDLGVSRQHIFGVLRGDWRPGPKLLKALGLRRVERLVRA